MKFMIGYNFGCHADLLDAAIASAEKIHEVYFPWGDIVTGRGTVLGFENQNILIADLKRLSTAGIGLNLLLNGNCYGRDSQSRAFFEKIGDCVDYLLTHLFLRSVTTSSPLIAKFLKANFEGLEIRASVNMEIGTVQGMDYLADYFDSFYMCRDYNRNRQRILQLKSWCNVNGKKLFLLANSGCLNHCSAHNFHDNLVAHESEISAMDNAYEFRGICHDYLRNPAKQPNYLRDTNFIRPEDIALYEKYFTVAKLATRTSRNPVQILNAYLKGSYKGNVLELLEPNHSEAFYPAVVENGRILAEFGAHLLDCPKNCENCNYCKEIFHNAIVHLNKEISAYADK